MVVEGLLCWCDQLNAKSRQETRTRTRLIKSILIKSYTGANTVTKKTPTLSLKVQ